MKKLLLATGLYIGGFTVAHAQLFRFHHVLPETQPPVPADAGVTSADKVVSIDIKPEAESVAQNYPVETEINVKFLYRNLTSKNATDIYTGRKGLWATVKQNSAGVPIVDVWQITKLVPTESRTSVISENTILKDHQIEIDLSRNTVGDPTRVIKIPFRAFLVSYNTVPLRVRLDAHGSTNPTPATTNLSFAVNFGGVRGNSFFSPRGVNHYGYAVSGFLGATTVTLNKTAYRDINRYDYDRTQLGLSTGVAFTLIRNNIGLVGALGIDHCTGPRRDDWIYQRKIWLGFGISTGLGFF